MLIFILIDFFVSSSEDFMRQKLTLSIWAALLAVTISHADNLCVQLCTDCSVDPANATCSKVDQVCGSCPAILDSVQHVEDSLALVREQDSLAAIARADSIQKEKERKDSLQKIEVRKLAEIILKNCKNDTCNFIVSVSDGFLGNVRGAKGNKAAKKEGTAQDSSNVALLPPMSEECVNFCGTCSDAEDGSVNPICEKIENQCRCNDYAEQERQLAEKAKADSVAAIEKALAGMEASQMAAQQVFDYCLQNAKAAACSVTVKLGGESFTVIQIQDLPKKEQTVVVPKATSVAPKDTVTKKVKSKNPKAAKSPVVETVPAENNPQKEKKNFYMGLTLAYESFHEKYFSDYSIDSESEDGDGFHLGFLVKWYFWDWMVFQTGLNGVYHSSDYAYSPSEFRYLDYAIGSVESKVFLFDLPLQLRIGVPFEKNEFLLFFSTSFHVRRPFYASVRSEMGWNRKDAYDSSYLYWTHDEFEEDGFYRAGDWEFLLYLGFGVELTRNFSVQWQFAPMYRATYTWITDNYGEGGDVWRINMDIAW